jgi:hypothetical protein
MIAKNFDLDLETTDRTLSRFSISRKKVALWSGRKTPGSRMRKSGYNSCDRWMMGGEVDGGEVDGDGWWVVIGQQKTARHGAS